MRLRVDDKKFIKDINNVIAYSYGFLDGVNIGKPRLLKDLGLELKNLVAEFIDSNARVDPSSLHHVYEWYQTGSPQARLFDIDYKVFSGGLSLEGTLTQSSSFARGSNTPFYNKAKIMESGTPVTITPVRARVLRFEQNGETIFTKGPVTVNNPGGDNVQGSFYETFKSFFIVYASQSIFDISGMSDRLKTATAFKESFAAGAKGGRPVGVAAGIKYISGGIN
jgi:hypothetical protein